MLSLVGLVEKILRNLPIRGKAISYTPLSTEEVEDGIYEVKYVCPVLRSPISDFLDSVKFTKLEIVDIGTNEVDYLDDYDRNKEPFNTFVVRYRYVKKDR